VTLRSFGVPYLSPMAPIQGGEMKDVLLRAHLWKFNTRPHLTGKDNNIERQSPDQKPNPDYGDDETSKGKGGS
jgi:Bacillus/Clostridium GerA spore germination protein